MKKYYVEKNIKSVLTPKKYSYFYNSRFLWNKAELIKLKRLDHKIPLEEMLLK